MNTSAPEEESMFSTMAGMIRALVPLTDEELTWVRPLVTELHLKKGAMLLTEKNACNHVTYIHQGFFRIFIEGDPKEVTIHLAGPGEFIAAFDSFISRTASVENIQAITDASLLQVNYEDLQILYNKSHNIEKLGRLVIEQLFVSKERRVISFIKDPAEQRYHNFCNAHPEFIKNIPLQYIASYLGISPETLSRIRAK